MLLRSGPGVCSGLLHGMYSVSPAPCPPSIHPSWPARLRAACVGCTWRWGHPPCAGAHPCLSVFRQDSLGRLLCWWHAFLSPQMTSETVISLSSRLWDVIVASFVGDYPTAEAVQRAFPHLRYYHDLEVWGDLDRQGSESRMRTLVPVDDVRAELTALANRGESCALHVEVVAPHGMPPVLCGLG